MAFRVLIIGGTGQVGAAVVRALALVSVRGEVESYESFVIQ